MIIITRVQSENKVKVNYDIRIEIISGHVFLFYHGRHANKDNELYEFPTMPQFRILSSIYMYLLSFFSCVEFWCSMLD